MESIKCMYADDLTIAYKYGYTNRKSSQVDYNIKTWALILFYQFGKTILLKYKFAIFSKSRINQLSG